MGVKYFEVVTPELDAACAAWSKVHGVDFGEPVGAMGQARMATMPDGAWVGIRKPLADHESTTTRAYHEVEDIAAAMKAAESAGATLAYGPMEQGDYGTFAIYILDDVQYGLWQG